MNWFQDFFKRSADEQIVPQTDPTETPWGDMRFSSRCLTEKNLLSSNYAGAQLVFAESPYNKESGLQRGLFLSSAGQKHFLQCGNIKLEFLTPHEHVLVDAAGKKFAFSDTPFAKNWNINALFFKTSDGKITEVVPDNGDFSRGEEFFFETQPGDIRWKVNARDGNLALEIGAKVPGKPDSESTIEGILLLANPVYMTESIDNRVDTECLLPKQFRWAKETDS